MISYVINQITIFVNSLCILFIFTINLSDFILPLWYISFSLDINTVSDFEVEDIVTQFVTRF